MAVLSDNHIDISAYESDDRSEVNDFNSLAFKRNNLDSEKYDIEKDRLTIIEIAKMADRMDSLLQETRRTVIETHDKLRKIELDLYLVAMEKLNDPV
jgi:hypothetical protein